MIITNFKQLEPFRHKSGIYIFINKKDPTKCYIGKSKNLYRRIAIEHKCSTNYKIQYIDRVIRKYGLLEYFHIELFHWWDKPIDNNEVLGLEAAAIDEYKSLKQFGGYNILLFGTDRTGFKNSQETKNKMSQSKINKYKNGYISPLKGRKASEETKKRLSQCKKTYFNTHPHPFIGKRHTQKSKQQNRDTWKKKYENGYINPRIGVKLDIKARQRISETHKGLLVGKRNPNFDHTIFCVKNKLTGELFKGTKYDFSIKINVILKRIYEFFQGKKVKISKIWQVI